jgi:hypothetical protein
MVGGQQFVQFQTVSIDAGVNVTMHLVPIEDQETIEAARHQFLRGNNDLGCKPSPEYLKVEAMLAKYAPVTILAEEEGEEAESEAEADDEERPQTFREYAVPRGRLRGQGRHAFPGLVLTHKGAMRNVTATMMTRELGSVPVLEEAGSEAEAEAYRWWLEQPGENRAAAWLAGVYVVRTGLLGGLVRTKDASAAERQLRAAESQLEALRAQLGQYQGQQEQALEAANRLQQAAYRRGQEEREGELKRLAALLEAREGADRRLLDATLASATAQERERLQREMSQDRERLLREAAQEREKLARTVGALEHAQASLARAEAELRDRRSMQERIDCLLMHSNHAKGAVGEHLVASELGRRFPGLYVELKGGGIESRSQDVWMHLSNSRGFLAFEAKNKSSGVTKADIDKFYRDLESMPTCAGAMFVSLASGSIPGRGRFAVEVHDRRPCMFVAFEDHEAFRLTFGDYAQVLASIASHVKHEEKESDEKDDSSNIIDELRALVEKVTPVLERLRRWRRDVAKLAAKAKDSWRLIESLQTSINEAASALEDALQVTKVAAASSSTAAKGKEEATCAVCSRTFGSRAACTRHERTVHNT